MSDDTSLALNGELGSTWGSRESVAYTLRNVLPVAICVYMIEADGEHSGWDASGSLRAGSPGYDIAPGGTAVIDAWHVGAIALLLTRDTGAFVGIYEFPQKDEDVPSAPQSFSVSAALLTVPNDIGAPPSPDPDRGVVIPTDGTRVLVGCAIAPNRVPVTREQFWQRLPASFCLAPGETRTVSFSATSGMETTSSDQSTVAASLGLDVSAGWGPISASVSATLNRSSSTFHSVTLNTSSTSFYEERFTNPDRVTSLAVLYWQLTDVVTIFDSSGHPAASVITGQRPTVVTAGYDPNTPPSFSTTVVTKERGLGVPRIRRSVEQRPAREGSKA